MRGLELKKISHSRYRELKKDADKAFQEYLHQQQEKLTRQKEQGSRPNPYRIRANRIGHLFARSVLDAFRSGAIQPTQASSLLDTHINHFPKLEAFVFA